jgi:hypothetical protein
MVFKGSGRDSRKEFKKERIDYEVKNYLVPERKRHFFKKSSSNSGNIIFKNFFSRGKTTYFLD